MNKFVILIIFWSILEMNMLQNNASKIRNVDDV